MTEPRPDLEHLRLFVAIADHESLGAAARSLGMAQPNASRSLSRLERQLGLSLVVRSPTGSHLTAHGAVAVQWARDVIEAAERLVSGAQALRAESTANLRLAASMTVAEYLVPAWLAEFRRRHEEVQVNLEVCNSVEVCARVARGACDLGLVESPTLPRNLHSMALARDHLVVVVSPDHGWARRRRPLLAAELAATPLITREIGSGTRVALERHLRSHSMVDPALELGSNSAVKVMAASNLAPAVLSHLAVAASLASGELVAVPVADLTLRRTLRAVWSGHITGAAEDFLRIARPGHASQR